MMSSTAFLNISGGNLNAIPRMWYLRAVNVFHGITRETGNPWISSKT